MSIGTIAGRIETALQAGTDLRDAVEEAYAYLATQGITWPVHVGVGGSNVLVFIPGFGPLSDPRDYVKLSKRVT